MRVLIVDDLAQMRRLTKFVLNQIGRFEMEFAEDGQEALAIVGNSLRFDLVFCDVRMPVMDGFQFLQRFRQRDQLTPVVMLTAEDDRDMVIQALKLGATDYVIKPFKSTTIEAKMTELFGITDWKYATQLRPQARPEELRVAS